jgi:hypothetical protein
MKIFLPAKIRKDKDSIQPLPKRFQEMMSRLAKELGAKKFILYGGAAMDLLINSSHKVHDLDIAIISDRKDVEYYIENLKKAGYEILEGNREYHLNIIDPVTIVFAKNNEWTLDVAFLNGPLERKINLVPPSAYCTTMDKFDIDSVFWRFPQLDSVDLYDAFGALKNRTMRPLYSLYEENPYLLINRMINMCAKYQMDICDNPVHKKSFEVLKERVRQWKHSGEFHGKLVKIAHYSTVLKAIKRSKNREKFIVDLAQSGILRYTMPELQAAIENINDSQKKQLKNVATKLEIANLLKSMVLPNKKIILEQRFRLLGLRTWDLDDRGINE